MPSETEFARLMRAMESKPALDRARRCAQKYGYTTRKSRLGIGLDNYGGLRIVDTSSNSVAAGEKYDLTPEEVIDWIELMPKIDISVEWPPPDDGLLEFSWPPIGQAGTVEEYTDLLTACIYDAVGNGRDPHDHFPATVRHADELIEQHKTDPAQRYGIEATIIAYCLQLPISVPGNDRGEATVLDFLSIYDFAVRIEVKPDSFLVAVEHAERPQPPEGTPS